MTQRLKLLYPFLFAIIPILSLVIRNPGQPTLGDIGVVVGSALVACGLLYAIAALMPGSRWSSPVIPLVLVAVIAWFYQYDTLASVARKMPGEGPQRWLLLIPAAVTVVVVWWLAQRPRILERVNTFFAISGTILVVWLGARFVMDQVRARAAIRNSTLAKELARPIPVKPSPASTLSQPDIYLIILDEYANSSVLRERFGFDNRMFEDSLRQLGFTIPREIRSNYNHTSLSLPSLLNFAHLNRLSAEVGTRTNDPTLPNHLLENNRTVTFLKSRGYKFLFFPSQWWSSTKHNRNADWEFQAWSGLDIGREATTSDLRRSLVLTTALKLLKKGDLHDADHVKLTLAALKQAPPFPQPTFAFAHVISPHMPYALGADCQVLNVKASSTWNADMYLDQLQCINHLVLGVVTTLLQRSSVPPIILLQGDHGTPSLRYSTAKIAEAVSPAQARERFGAFGAYHVPDGGAKLFADSVTLVNVFQKVLNYYFGANVPPASDRLYFSMDRTPYLFAEFDPASLTHPRSADADPKLGLER